ncbi:protein of unknown function [Azospirillum lipoferum 4B]|uniref:Uncharacterized protein n=1 Tax=Azospirillum lipoferum (strain 4B) TaxID=862719 RepID=G7Z5Y3_AZOL4|nr:protein of unknown function [Azospirillum lipoferum 4B]
MPSPAPGEGGDPPKAGRVRGDPHMDPLILASPLTLPMADAMGPFPLPGRERETCVDRQVNDRT